MKTISDLYDSAENQFRDGFGKRQDPRLQGRAPGQERDRDKTGRRQGQDRDKSGA